MKNIIIISMLLVPMVLSAQQEIYWKGGTPGNENAWDVPKNWDRNRVPTETDKVIIRHLNNGHDSQPIIQTDVVVSWIEIHSGSRLTVQKGRSLTIGQSELYSEGISIYGGEIVSEGDIVVNDIHPSEMRLSTNCQIQDQMIKCSSESLDFSFQVRSTLTSDTK